MKGIIFTTFEAFITDSFGADVYEDILDDTELINRKCDLNKPAPSIKGRRQDLPPRLDILIEPDGEPVGGRWNYDDENRERPPKDGRHRRTNARPAPCR